ncbi:MAG: tRNA lysidine(34) synthetase TilS [Bdellovibrionota bacterium]
MTQARYPKPKAVGGKLIREVIAHLKRHNIALPLTSHILLATSGGSDSVALAHLLATYGRRIIPDPKSQLTLLHINHGWRGRESGGDERFVKALAKSLGVNFIAHRLKPPKEAPEGWESAARAERQRIYLTEAGHRKALVLTAHHADDLAETVLWRLFTGQADTHGGGIAVKTSTELRPLLTVRKELLQEYLREERQRWREDRTNQEGRFLRSKMRAKLMPCVEELFPKAVEQLAKQALRAQLTEDERGSDSHLSAIQAFLGAAGLRARRPHLEQLRRLDHPKELNLPGGWRLLLDRFD